MIEALTLAAQPPDPHGYSPFRGLPELRAALAERYRTVYGVTLDPETDVAVVPGTKTARSAGCDDPLLADTGGCPRRVTRVAGTGAASGEADEDAADSRSGLEAPPRRLERGQRQLLLDQLLA